MCFWVTVPLIWELLILCHYVSLYSQFYVFTAQVCVNESKWRNVIYDLIWLNCIKDNPPFKPRTVSPWALRSSHTHESSGTFCVWMHSREDCRNVSPPCLALQLWPLWIALKHFCFWKVAQGHIGLLVGAKEGSEGRTLSTVGPKHFAQTRLWVQGVSRGSVCLFRSSR